MDAQEVTVSQLYSIIGGSGVSIDWLKEQMVPDLDEGKPYRHNHKDINYLVPLAELEEFFKTHRRPERKMNAAEEAAMWKAKYLAADKELQTYRKPPAVAPEQPMRFDGDDLIADRVRMNTPKPTENARTVDIAEAVTPLQAQEEEAL
jgi:hypothetical protein